MSVQSPPDADRTHIGYPTAVVGTLMGSSTALPQLFLDSLGGTKVRPVPIADRLAVKVS